MPEQSGGTPPLACHDLRPELHRDRDADEEIIRRSGCIGIHLCDYSNPHCGEEKHFGPYSKSLGVSVLIQHQKTAAEIRPDRVKRQSQGKTFRQVNQVIRSLVKAFIYRIDMIEDLYDHKPQCNIDYHIHEFLPYRDVSKQS